MEFTGVSFSRGPKLFLCSKATGVITKASVCLSVVSGCDSFKIEASLRTGDFIKTTKPVKFCRPGIWSG